MAITVDVASLGTPVAIGTPVGTAISMTTTSAIAAGALVVVGNGWFDTTDTMSTVTVDGNACTVVQVANGSFKIALSYWRSVAGLASGKVITSTTTGIPSAAYALGAASFLGTDSITPVSGNTGPTNGTTAAWSSASSTLAAGGALVSMSKCDGSPTMSNTPSGGTSESFDVDSDGTANVMSYKIDGGAGGAATCSGTFVGTFVSPSVVMALILAPASGGGGASRTLLRGGNRAAIRRASLI